jgi:hypothetical protein
MASEGITLAMIARDEAGCIADAIRSCDGVVDDIVVVDTGSTDGTVEIAKSLKARVFHQPWDDSFSKPRNFGLEQVRTKWVMVLDCDEKLGGESRQKVIDACRSDTVHGFIVNVIVHGPTGASPTRALRIGRADFGYRFCHRIHERVFPQAQSLTGTQIVIDHFGYLYKPRRAKAGFYTRLLELDVQDYPTDNYLLINLVHNYWTAGNPRWEEYVPRAIATLARDSAKPPHGLTAVLLEMILLLRREKVPAGLTQAEADELAERWFPASLPLLVDRAKWRIHEGRHREGQDMAKRALDLCERKAFQPDIAFEPGPILKDLRRIAESDVTHERADLLINNGGRCV